MKQQEMQQFLNQEPRGGRSEQSAVMDSILQLGNVFNGQVAQNRSSQEQRSDDESEETDDSEDESDCQKCGRSSKSKKKPEQIRKQFYEILLRRRIFLTDRVEKFEKALVTAKMISEEELLKQSQQIVTEAVLGNFKAVVEQSLKDEAVLAGLKADVAKINEDDQWYELYKSYTNEKDLAERD